MAAAVSLEDAIEAKYCPRDEDAAADRDALPAYSKDAIKVSALKFGPGGIPVQRRSSFILDGSGVTRVECAGKLGELCPQATELHLSGNGISECKDVLAILSALPQLNLLDLTNNPLDAGSFASFTPPPLPPQSLALQPHTGLQTLVLNGTCLKWSAVQLCLEKLPQLEELHLCKNGHGSVDLPPDFQHPPLKKLQISNNTFSSWAECEKLSKAFPRLQSLVATSNPIAEVPPQRGDLFAELTSLNLNSSLLSRWKDIEHLAALKQLSDLSVLNLPLGEELKMKERRFAFISRMPGLLKLNKTTITAEEREEAERWLIRVFADKPEQPSGYASLVERHGALYQLADVDLSPKKTVKIEFYFKNDKECEVHVIKLAQSAQQLKKWISKRIGIPASAFKLLYDDVGSIYGLEEMWYEQRALYRYGLKEGDRIYVQRKLSRVKSNSK